MRLDIGCGTQPTGDFNCDLYPEDVGHRGKYHKTIHTEAIPNFRLADVQNLPYDNGSFEEVYSSHTIEHVENPFRMLKEMVRVSNDWIIIKCPHRLGDRIRGMNPSHINFFNMTWFMNAFAKLGLRCEIHYSKFRCYPSEILTIFKVPNELTVTSRKCWRL